MAWKKNDQLLPKKYEPESLYYVQEEEERELPEEGANIPPEIAELMYGIEDISLLEGPEKRRPDFPQMNNNLDLKHLNH